MKKIIVDPPVSEARRERVERQLFQQLAAVRVADRAEAVIPPAKKQRAPMWFAFAGVAVAAAAIVFLATRDGGTGGQTVAPPSRVVTPVGGETRFIIGRDAVVDAKSDTNVEWQQFNDGSVTLTLARGAVDCQVHPRQGRPPFKVISGDVTVLVVGTRFTVTRTPSPRVDVAHGKVRVEAPGGTWSIEAGESWTPISVTAIEEPVLEEPEPAPVEEPEPQPVAPVKVSRAKRPAPVVVPEPKAAPIEPPATRELARDAYKAAQRLEVTDPALAAANYRAIARGRDPGWAATALVALAELSLKQGEPKAALDALDAHSREFPRSAMREDAAWFRIEALRAMGKRDEARGAAADYLREFPDGVYVKPAGRLVK
jgi:hypothetical protein